ncbi:unnamed protein product [Miscanthus lutarioriparius]|uniref:Cobalamin-independent methionine synthase MetE N-terminal domain-containing protein n=1 Tax=Miscanthus lutarioriparius TaxID=422564 RepID=A0A811QIS7_9POAL|nr:unnamed protein product [Miscanthus lutarioriparius]
MEMTKWFDTNYHFIVPELGPSTKFTYASHKVVSEYKEAKALGIDTVPVLVGPVSYLLLSKPAKGVEKSFSLLSLLGSILPIYKEVVSKLKAAGASWIQFDEPTLVKDLDAHELAAFSMSIHFFLGRVWFVKYLGNGLANIQTVGKVLTVGVGLNCRQRVNCRQRFQLSA